MGVTPWMFGDLGTRRPTVFKMSKNVAGVGTHSSLFFSPATMTGRSRSIRQSPAPGHHHSGEPIPHIAVQQIFPGDTSNPEPPEHLQSNPDEAQKKDLNAEDTETLLRELNSDLVYLLGRAEALNKKRGKILARRAPMNRLPSEVRVAVLWRFCGERP